MTPNRLRGAPIRFQECAGCASKPGSPSLCTACLHNRATIDRLLTVLRATLDQWVSSIPTPPSRRRRGNEQLVDGPREEHVIAAPETPRPLVEVSVLVTKQDKLLLGKRRGSPDADEYAVPGGCLEHQESFQACARREVAETTGIEVGPPRFLRALNATSRSPRHCVDLAFAAEWQAGELSPREPNEVECWDWCWHSLDELPSPLSATLPSAIEVLRGTNGATHCWDVP